MNIKLFGSIMVIIACGGFGFSLAANHRADIRFLRALIGVLNYMECELNYRLTPLPQLCRQAAAEHTKTLGAVFNHFADALDSQISPDTNRCMQMAVAKCAPLSGIAKECLLELGRSLGKFDLQGQLAGLDAIRQTCRRKLKELENNKDVRLRSYQTLGLCTGAAIAILLI